MQKITYIKYITSSLSVLVLLSSTAMAMEGVGDESTKGGTLVQHTPQTDEVKAPQGYERSYFNPRRYTQGAWVSTEPGSTEAVHTTIQPTEPQQEQQDDKKETSLAVISDSQKPVSEVVASAVDLEDQKPAEEVKTAQGYYRSYLNPRRYTQGAWVSTEPGPTEAQQRSTQPTTFTPQATDPTLGKQDEQQGQSQAIVTNEDPSSELTDTFFGSAARVYEAAGDNPEAKALLDAAMAKIAENNEQKKK